MEDGSNKLGKIMRDLIDEAKDENELIFRSGGVAQAGNV